MATTDPTIYTVEIRHKGTETWYELTYDRRCTSGGGGGGRPSDPTEYIESPFAL